MSTKDGKIIVNHDTLLKSSSSAEEYKISNINYEKISNFPLFKGHTNFNWTHDHSKYRN